MATRQQFTADPAFSSDISLIYDLGLVTRIDMTSDQIRGLARFSPLDQKVRRAIVANEPGVYGAMRMLALDYEANGGLNEIGVFKCIEDAEKWLGLAIRDSACS